MTMEKPKSNPVHHALNKLYGGINMTWPKVILFAVGTAVVTSVFLIVPVFENTSFERMGVTPVRGMTGARPIIPPHNHRPEPTLRPIFTYSSNSQATAWGSIRAMTHPKGA